MRIYEQTHIFQEYARLTHQWCMIISFNGNEDFSEIIKAAPYLSFERDIQVFYDGVGLLSFNSEEEMRHYYLLTVGDDGPTSLNNYNGPYRVYAVTISPDGELLSENT